MSSTETSSFLRIGTERAQSEQTFIHLFIAHTIIMIIAHTEKMDYVSHKAAVISAGVIVRKKAFVEFTANAQRTQE